MSAWRRVRMAVLVFLLGATAAFAGERQVVEVAPKDAPYAPYIRWTPSTNAPRLDWLLVTPREFLPAFAPLVEHRRETGLVADAVALEDVAGDILLGGGDLPERLRTFVRLLHERYGLRFLVLGGDSNRLPSRMVPFPVKGPKVHYGEPYAGDAYFGCLDGEWNADMDSRFGEAEPGDDDDPDVRHEVHVGRVPVESLREAEIFVKKLLLYERPVHLDYQNRVAFLGGKVFQEGDADRFYRDLNETFFAPLDFQPVFFTIAGPDTGAAKVMKALSEGVGVVCHYHHSFTYNLSLPTGAIDTGNVGEVANAERPFVLFSNGCYSNQFTKEGISEKLLLSEAGGAVAFIGSTNTCYSSSLGLEKAFWEILLASKRDVRIGEALSFVRGEISARMAVMAFLRLSFNLLGDPATPLWTARPERPKVTVESQSDGSLQVSVAKRPKGALQVACYQAGRWGAPRPVVSFPPDETRVVIPSVVGNGTPLRVTVYGPRTVPVTRTADDPAAVRVTGVRAAADTLHVALAGAEDLAIPLPPDLSPGPWSLEETVAGLPLHLSVPVLDGTDAGYVRGDEERRLPGFGRLAAPREDGLPLLTEGPPRVVETEAAAPAVAGDLSVAVDVTESAVRLGWSSTQGVRWLVERRTPRGGRRLLTPVPLVNPVFEMDGLEPLTRMEFLVSRLDRAGETVVEAATSFAYQAGFPQNIGANVTSVQVLDLDGRRGNEVVFGDDRLGAWALNADGSEVRHAGDAWTFGLFAAIESGVFEPIVADVVGSRTPEIVVTSKLKDRKLYVFDRKGNLLRGFPVTFRSRLMTPPLVGDFDGKRGNEILVVSGFGKTVELVKPDGQTKPFAEIGQYNYAYPIAVNLDRDRALEVVILDGAGALWAFDQGGVPMDGFPVELGSPGRCTPMVANLDADRGLEIVAVGKGTTRLAVVDARTGDVQVDWPIPEAGKPADHSFFYPALARFGRREPYSILVATPSKKLFALDLAEKGRAVVVRDGFPLSLPAEARGIAAVDIDADGIDELFLSLHDGAVWGVRADGTMLEGFPLQTGADTYTVPLLQDLDMDGDLELFVGAADGILRVWDLPYRVGRASATWAGVQGGAGLPGTPASTAR